MSRDRIAPARGVIAAGYVKYLSGIPASVPEGRVVVHNHVRPPRLPGSRDFLPLGWNGFRAWLASPSKRLEVCDCGWAPKLTKHYRVKRAG
jgi:hypothetical protein